MPHITRRETISAVLAGFFSALSGCANREKDNSRLCEFTVANQDDESHTVNVTIRDSSSVRLERRFDIESEQDDGSSYTLNEQLPIEGESLTLEMSVDGNHAIDSSIENRESRTIAVFASISNSQPELYFATECQPSLSDDSA